MSSQEKWTLSKSHIEKYGIEWPCISSVSHHLKYGCRWWGMGVFIVLLARENALTRSPVALMSMSSFSATKHNTGVLLYACRLFRWWRGRIRIWCNGWCTTWRARVCRRAGIWNVGWAPHNNIQSVPWPVKRVRKIIIAPFDSCFYKYTPSSHIVLTDIPSSIFNRNPIFKAPVNLTFGNFHQARADFSLTEMKTIKDFMSIEIICCETCCDVRSIHVGNVRLLYINIIAAVKINQSNWNM